MRSYTRAIVLIALFSVLGAALAQEACPLMPSDFAQVDWPSVQAACVPGPPASFCRSCICGIGRGLVSGLYAVGVNLDASQATLDSLLTTCTATVGGQLVENGGFSVETLTGLAQCDVAEVSSECAAALEAEQGDRADAAQLGATSGAPAAAAPAGGASASAAAAPAAAARVALWAAGGLALLDARSTYHSVYTCPGVPKWALVPALWTPLSMKVNCSAPTFEIFTAPSWEALHQAPQPVRWCGLAHFTQPDACAFQVSPFEEVYVGVKTRRNSILGRIGGAAIAPEPQCSFSARREFSMLKATMAALGVALFMNARALTASPTFRLGAGTLTFMSGAALVVAFILMRSLPHKKKLAAAMAVSASSVVAAVRWAYGTWAPDAVALLTSRGALVYFLVTGLLGLAVTYWLDDATNIKLNNTVCAVLYLTGLLLVYLGTTSEEVALVLIGLLVASRVLAPVLRRLAAAARWLLGRLGAGAAAAAGKGRGAAARRGAAKAPAALEDAGGMRAAGGGSGGARPRSGGIVKRGPARELLLSDDEERETAEEARRMRREAEARALREAELRRQRQRQRELEEREWERAARESVDDQAGSLNVWLGGGAGARGQQQQEQQQQAAAAWQWPSTRRGAQQQQPQQPAPPQPQRPAPPTFQPPAAPAAAPRSGGWFSRWSNTGGEDASVGGAPAGRAAQAPPAVHSPLHLRASPPSPSSPDERPAARQARPRQQQPAAAPAQQPQRKASLLFEDESSSDDEAGDRRTPAGGGGRGGGGGGGPQRSPWSQERLVVDLNRPPSGRRAAPAASPPARGGAPRAAAPRPSATPPAAGGGGGRGGGDMSPLVAAGKIFNEESGRVIQIGKGKYEELVARGYTPDLQRGVLLLPAGGGGGAGGSGGGDARPRAAAARASRRG
ncbi:MAG: hypothetical protein J3K34DRAFT_455414 [Monoraphidium minutum]|nr:MAG: hypothetical protein J3K34DRAFT_455414 [Monoraphidium minutum]